MTEKPASTLTKQTIDNILGYIEKNNIKPGDKLPTEAAFLELFGVSRIILREAFSYLKGLGLVESRRGSGFRFANVDFAGAMEQALKHISIVGEDGIEELLELRHHLELGTIYEAVRNATDDDITKIRETLQNLETVCQKESPTYQEYQHAELDFHQAIMNSAKCRTLNIINLAIKKSFDAAQQPGKHFDKSQNSNMEREYNEHKMISLCFELNWPDVAVTCLRKHFLKS